MEILVTEGTPGAATFASELLTAAGHRVHRCYESSAHTFPCVALGPDGCPLDQVPMDLVLTVRPHIRTSPGPTEDGVACGLRRHVPVAISGQSVLNPYAAFGAEAMEGDLVDECERIARSNRQGHERVAMEVMRDTLRAQGYSPDAGEVAVHRVDGRLRVLIGLPDIVPERARQVVAVRVAGRLRAFDHDAAGIDIGLTTIGVADATGEVE
jgi:hypothetical protein